MPMKSLTGRGPLGESFVSLKTDPIPISDPETLATGWKFLLAQFPLLAPVYALAWMPPLVGRSFQDSVPSWAATIVLLLVIPYLFWSIGVADRSRRGLPRFGGSPLPLLRTGWSIWWRALLVAIRFVPAVFILGLVLGAIGIPRTGAAVIGLMASFAVLVPAFGFGVLFWDRWKSLAKVPEDRPASALPGGQRGSLAVIGAIWLVAGVGWWRGIALRNRSFDPCHTTTLTSVDQHEGTRTEIKTRGPYTAYVIVRDGLQSLHVVAGSSGQDVELLPPRQTRFLSLGFRNLDSNILYIYEDSTGRRMIEEIPIVGGSPTNYTRDNPHIRIAQSEDSRTVTEEWGSPGSCTRIPLRTP